MSLNKDRLGDAMADAVLTVSGLTPVAADETKLRDTMKALADEIIKEFIGNAVVTTVVTGTLPAGPVAAAGAGSIIS